MVVMVKKKLGTECRHFLYGTLKRGMMPSKIQKKVIPPIKIRLRCQEGMVSK
jgi:hypothetical protein